MFSHSLDRKQPVAMDSWQSNQLQDSRPCLAQSNSTLDRYCCPGSQNEAISRWLVQTNGLLNPEEHGIDGQEAVQVQATDIQHPVHFTTDRSGHDH